jgi:hypothetical protein
MARRSGLKVMRMPKIKTETPNSTNARNINLLIIKVVKIACQHFGRGRRE